MDIKALREKRDTLAKELKDLNQTIASIEGACSLHDWAPPQKELYEGYVVIEDGIEAHGSDVWAKTKTIPTTKVRWVRRCRKCGKTEYTEKLGMPKNVPQIPIFPGD